MSILVSTQDLLLLQLGPIQVVSVEHELATWRTGFLADILVNNFRR